MCYAFATKICISCISCLHNSALLGGMNISAFADLYMYRHTHRCKQDNRVATNLENLEYSGISLNMENSGNSQRILCNLMQGKIVTSKVFLVRHSNICVQQLLTGQTGSLESQGVATVPSKCQLKYYAPFVVANFRMTLDEGHYYIYFLLR